MDYKEAKKEYSIELIEVRNYTGISTPVFNFEMTKPFKAAGIIDAGDIKTQQGVTGIQFSKHSKFAKTACNGKQSVLVSIASEAVEYIKKTSEEEIEKLRIAAQEDPETWHWHTGCDTGNLMVSPANEWEFRPDLLEIKNTIEREHKFDAYELFGVTEGRGEVSHEEIMRMYNEITEAKEKKQAEKKAAKEAKESAAFEAAKETGEPQIIDTYTVDVDNDPENSTDIVKVYAMPDGSKTRKVIHTY